MIDPETGRRYETCSLCGTVYNVPKTLKLPDDGYYECPVREYKERKRRTKK